MKISNPVDPPPGTRVLETDEQVKVIFPRNWTLWGAKRRAQRIMGRAIMPSYHLRIEKHGFTDYRVVPYQNVLVETESHLRRVK